MLAFVERKYPEVLAEIEEITLRLDEAQACFEAADAVFEQMSSVGHRAGAWVALGDLARRRGDDGEAARRYRSAAEALQDIRF